MKHLIQKPPLLRRHDSEVVSGFEEGLEMEAACSHAELDPEAACLKVGVGLEAAGRLIKGLRGTGCSLNVVFFEDF